MPVEPYLFFEGRCEEAANFYREVLGAEITMLMRMKESPEAHPPGMLPPGSEDKVMHMNMRIGNTTLMASDGRCSGKPNFQGFSLSLSPKDEADAQRIYKALAEGGQARVPLTKTFFSPCFGMVADRFGVPWMLNVGP